MLGTADIFAELLFDKGSGLQKIHTAHAAIYLGGGVNPNLDKRIYLPVVQK